MLSLTRMDRQQVVVTAGKSKPNAGLFHYLCYKIESQKIITRDGAISYNS